jgi:hypothetical protein
LQSKLPNKNDVQGRTIIACDHPEKHAPIVNQSTPDYCLEALPRIKGREKTSEPGGIQEKGEIVFTIRRHFRSL